MNKLRFRFLTAAVALLLMAGGVQAQTPTSVQRISISLFGEYQTNQFFTNAMNLTNENAKLHDVLIATGNVIKAIAVDLDGTNWTNWAGASLVREVNLTNGNEGIFLRLGGKQTNVSSFFDGSFSNNFTAGLTNFFPGATNGMSGLTNNINGSTNNPNPSFQLVQGWLRMTSLTNFTTNFTKTAGLYFISLNTTNVKFNYVAAGGGSVSTVSAPGGTIKARINSEVIAGAGAFFLNGGTNIFDMGAVEASFFTGPMRGTIIVGAPYYAGSITNGP